MLGKADMVRAATSMTVIISTYATWPCKEGLNWMIAFLAVKGPLKYLVAKLHGCYPGANSLPVSQNFFARFFRRRPVADSSRCLTFLLRCNKHKKRYLLTFFLLMFFFTVTTSEWCLYFLNLAVLLENFIQVQTY